MSVLFLWKMSLESVIVTAKFRSTTISSETVIGGPGNRHPSNCWGYVIRDNFVYAPSQWETTLQCNVVSHWLGAYTKWSLPYDTVMSQLNRRSHTHQWNLANAHQIVLLRFYGRHDCEFRAKVTKFYNLNLLLDSKSRNLLQENKDAGLCKNNYICMYSFSSFLQSPRLWIQGKGHEILQS